MFNDQLNPNSRNPKTTIWSLGFEAWLVIGISFYYLFNIQQSANPFFIKPCNKLLPDGDNRNFHLAGLFN